MQEIIAPVDSDLIKKELTQEAFIRYTNNGNNEIYLVNHRYAPHTVQEIGRLREVTFRAAGGGTGLALDLDDNDTGRDAYDQLIAWNPEEEEIIAGYRLIKDRKSVVEGKSVSVSVDLGGRRIIKKTKTEYKTI